MGLQKVRIDLTGRVFDHLTVLEYAGRGKWGDALWKCICDRDGNVKVINGNSLRQGKTGSCGCWANENIGVRSLKHGMGGIREKRTVEYGTWLSMKRRCNSTKGRDYKDYGGRGIMVCERWNGPGGFINFFADMGEKPEPKKLYSLDRINNNGNYEPSNCRWATHQEQARNRRGRECPHCGHALYNDTYAKD